MLRTSPCGPRCPCGMGCTSSRLQMLLGTGLGVWDCSRDRTSTGWVPVTRAGPTGAAVGPWPCRCQCLYCDLSGASWSPGKWGRGGRMWTQSIMGWTPGVSAEPPVWSQEAQALPGTYLGLGQTSSALSTGRQRLLLSPGDGRHGLWAPPRC